MNLEKLKELRENNEYTMLSLSEKLNISKSTYSLWETGIERPPLKRVVDICDLYNISLDYLCDNTEIKQYKNEIKGINHSEFAKKFKDLRKELKYTQEKFANKLNLGRTTIINYEKEKTLPLLDHLIFISKKYNISIDYLLGKIDNPKRLK